jgi:hypothetical protein
MLAGVFLSKGAGCPFLPNVEAGLTMDVMGTVVLVANATQPSGRTRFGVFASSAESHQAFAGVPHNRGSCRDRLTLRRGRFRHLVSSVSGIAGGLNRWPGWGTRPGLRSPGAFPSKSPVAHDAPWKMWKSPSKGCVARRYQVKEQCNSHPNCTITTLAWEIASAAPGLFPFTGTPRRRRQSGGPCD